MGKKRSKTKDYEHLLNKVRKLEQSIKKRPRLYSTSSDEEDEDAHRPFSQSPVLHSEVHAVVHNTTINDDAEMSILSPLHSEKNYDNHPESHSGNENTIDPEILQILGDDPSNQNNYGDNLHKEIIPRWQYILTNGLEKGIKSELLKQYLPPENCASLRAPKLNLEVKAALNELNAKKEAFNENKQNQLSSCLAALGKALNLALCSNENAIPQDIIKPLSDAGRLLCDYHYRESQSRRYAVINTLNKEIRDTVKNTKIDEFLFGSNLAEQIKSAKAITKSGSELKIPRPQYKPPATGPPQRGALNSRGARGAASATRQNPPRRPPTAPATSTRGRDHHFYDAVNSRRTNNLRGRSTTTRR